MSQVHFCSQNIILTREKFKIHLDDKINIWIELLI